jgi:pSer/pThr/pTyr-binding forkhead associated (FHA) protein
VANKPPPGRNITIQVLEGVDRGRVFRELPTPLTIGREEGNLLRLNDERVSRYHAKIQQDNGDLIITDLESTNGTRVNGNVVQIRRLRLGDCITVGRSLLLFGSNEEIAARMGTMAVPTQTPPAIADDGSVVMTQGPATVQAQACAPLMQNDLEFDLNPKDQVTVANGDLFIGSRPLPPLPQKLSPAQAARIAEILDFLHRGLTRSTENIRANDEGTEVKLSFSDWQKVLAVQMLLARYLRAIAEPDVLQE